MSKKIIGVLAFAAGLYASASPTTLVLSSTTRARIGFDEAAISAAKRFGKNLATLTRQERDEIARRNGARPIFSMPVRVFSPGSHSSAPSSRGRGDGLTLQFSASGSTSFPADYQAFLQSVFNRVEPLLTSTFGLPESAATVQVINYENTIGERDAVAGGIYAIDGGTGERKIYFPEYTDGTGIKKEVAAVNFIHTLLLAYMGSKPLPYDGWDEGLARAATMRIVRTPGSLPPDLDQDAVELVLQSTYDTSETYDWNNQKALAGPEFIAPNLVSQPLPLGGSIGGLYLLRYQMAGTAFQKVLVQYPLFAAHLLQRYYANPSLYQTYGTLITLFQQALQDEGGVVVVKVEDLPAALWVPKQFILNPHLVPGKKLLVQAFPITSNLESSDFGVFGIQAHWFTTDKAGNESLGRGISYPIYWSPDFTRIFASGQDDRMDISLGYGSVAPNFSSSAFNGEPYRVTVDVPVEDRIARVYLPAGAVATAANPTPNNIYGILTGVTEGTDTVYTVNVGRGADVQTVSVRNLAFGASIPGFESAGSLDINVIRSTLLGQSIIFHRRVNKGPGPLALYLHVDGDRSVDLGGGIGMGLNMVGFPGDPYEPDVAKILGVTDANALFARWNPVIGRNDIYPSIGGTQPGFGFFYRSTSSSSLPAYAHLPVATPIGVALAPGWNAIVNPLDETTDVSKLSVAIAADFPRSFADAVAAGKLGGQLFEFVRGAPDPFSGAPETGTFSPITSIGPGQACFVRCFAAEGATLLFTPSLVATQTREQPPATPTWLATLTATGIGEASVATIGAQTGSRVEFDRATDAYLPPSGGALQVSLEGAARLSRDLRRPGAPSTYNVKLENLRKGSAYRFELHLAQGVAPKSVVVSDRTSGATATLQGDTVVLQFKANSTSRFFRVVTRG